MRVKTFFLILIFLFLTSCEKGIENPYSSPLPSDNPIPSPTEPSADLNMTSVSQGQAWNITIYCPASGYPDSSDWQMYMYMTIENTGDKTVMNIKLHLQIFDRWWRGFGAILIWGGETPFTDYNGIPIILGPNDQSTGWCRWTNLSLETLENLYNFLTTYYSFSPVHFWLTWDE